MEQPPLPQSAASGSGSSSEESDFIKVRNNNDGDDRENARQNDDEEEVDADEGEEEETPLSLKTHALLDILDSVQDFFTEALPELDCDRLKREVSATTNNNLNSSSSALLSITYIDKNIYESREYIPFVCDLMDLYDQKFDLYRRFAEVASKSTSDNNNNNKSCGEIHFGIDGTCYVEITGCDLGPENSAIIAERLFTAIARGCKPNGPNLTLRLDNNRMLKDGFDALSNKSILDQGNNIKNVLKDLSIRENSIRDDSMPQLAEILHVCPYLEDLSIGTSHIFPSGINILVQRGIETSPFTFKTLKTLNIEFNTLGDAGMITLARSLAKCYALEKLNVSDNSISDEGATAIAELLLPSTSCGPLRWLDMSVNQIGEVGAKAIAAALERSTSSDENKSRIEHLDIGCNPIGPEGGEALCRASQFAPRLTTLDLTTTDLTEKAGRLLVDALQLRPNVFKEAFIFECNNLSFEVRKKIAETMNSRRRLVVGPDDEFPQGRNLKRFGEKRQAEVEANNKDINDKKTRQEQLLKQQQNQSTSGVKGGGEDDAINWPLIGCVLGVSSIAIWYLLKPKN